MDGVTVGLLSTSTHLPARVPAPLNWLGAFAMARREHVQFAAPQPVLSGEATAGMLLADVEQ